MVGGGDVFCGGGEILNLGKIHPRGWVSVFGSFFGFLAPSPLRNRAFSGII